MIQLYDKLTPRVTDLRNSLKEAGVTGQTIVLEENGFLPEGVFSLYGMMCQFEGEKGKPLYFNQVPVPDGWQITGNPQQGEIWDHGVLKGKIFYTDTAPNNSRLVCNVDWLDDKQVVRTTDHYNSAGRCYARTFFNEAQLPTSKSYYDRSGREVIVENYQIGTTSLYHDGKVHLFGSNIDFYIHMIHLLHVDMSQVLFSTIGTPYYVARYLGGDGRDILFYQDAVHGQIPEQINEILTGQNERCQMVVIQDKAVYHELLSLVNPMYHDRIRYLGYIYTPIRENKNQKQALILTNSDQLVGIEELVTGLPDYNFSIGALTTMSPSLMGLGKYENVDLYPNISPQTVDKLYDTCDLYLDINHFDEILNATRRAFENNMLILAFDETRHNFELISDDAVYGVQNVAGLRDYLRSITSIKKEVNRQHQSLDTETVANYKAVLIGG